MRKAKAKARRRTIDRWSLREFEGGDGKEGNVVRERSEAWWSNWVKKERLGSGRRPCTVIVGG